MKAQLTMLSLGVVAMGFALGTPSEAKANHGPFSFQGSLCGCNGESQLIAALDHLNRAYEEQVHGHWSHAHSQADFAAADLAAACGLLSSRHAQNDVHAAERALEQYCQFRSIRSLQTAANLVAHALETEQAVFRTRYGQGHNHGGIGYGQPTVNPYPVYNVPAYNTPIYGNPANSRPVTRIQTTRPRITFRLGF